MISQASTSAGEVAEQHPLGSWSAYPAYCAGMAPLAQKLADDLTAYPWPPAASAQANDLAAGHNYLAVLYVRCAATNGSYSELVDIDRSLRDVEDYVAAANVALRVAIGLPADR
jgi:hypothetical protein